MADGSHINVAASLPDEVITDDQILQLLKGAEGRIRAAQADIHLSSDHEVDSTLSGLKTSITTGPASSFSVPYITSNKHGAQVDPSLLVSTRDRKLANGYRVVEDSFTLKKRAAEEKRATAGSQWFNIPRTVLTPELKRDLQLLRMRSVLDPKRHYKREHKKTNDVPEYSQIGTVIEGPTEFFTARMTNKQRKRTMMDEVLATEKVRPRFKERYAAIQASKTSGKKAFYKALKAKRVQRDSKG